IVIRNALVFRDRPPIAVAAEIRPLDQDRHARAIKSPLAIGDRSVPPQHGLVIRARELARGQHQRGGEHNGGDRTVHGHSLQAAYSAILTLCERYCSWPSSAYG